MTDNHSKNKAGGCCCGGCGTILVIFFLIATFRWMSGTKQPSLIIPPRPAAPSPNAFDTFRSATQLLANSAQVSDSIGTKPAVNRTLARKSALIDSNASALKMFRSGLSQEYSDTSARSIFTLFPYYAQFRAMARLLSLEGSVRAGRGDWNGAVQSSLDSMQMGVTIPRGGPLIGDLVGIACQSIGRKNLWVYIDHLDEQQSLQTVKRLLNIEQSHVPFADTMLEEKYMQMSALSAMFKGNNGIQAALGVKSSNSIPAAYQLMYLIYSKETIARNSQRYFDQLIANAAQPYAAHPADPPIPGDPINQILMPVFAQSRIKDVEAQTQNGLVCLSIALHEFKLNHAKYPNSLAELSPDIASKLPEDPFAKSGTFKYRLTGDKYVLYSIGPDGIDDGGKAIDDPSKSTSGNRNARYYIDSDSKGDIVAGKNIW